MAELRVLHVIPSVALGDGGPARAIRLIERALAESPVCMEVATTDDDGPGRRLREFCGADGRPLIAAPGAPLRRYFAKRTEFYKVAPGLARWLCGHVADYDLVHIHALFSFSSIAAAFAAHRAGVPYIVRPLGTLTRYGVEQRRPLLKRLSLRWVEGPILRHAAAVHFTAEAERDEALALGIPMRPAVVPLAVAEGAPVDASAFAARFPGLSEPGYLLFLSRLDPKKNVEALLHALARLLPAHPDLRLALVGDGEPAYVAGLHQLASDLGLDAHAVWTGFLDGGLKSAALAGALVFVLPSFSENFGIAAAEALRAGLPCVLGEGVAIAADVAAAGAGCAIAPTVEAVVAALAELLADPVACARAGNAARDFALANYSTSRLSQRLVALYQKILDEGAQ